MKCKCVYIISGALTIAAILVFMAGQPQIGWLSQGTARMVGTGLILVAGLSWAVGFAAVKKGCCCCQKDKDSPLDDQPHP